eukprot:gene280-961_t
MVKYAASWRRSVLLSPAFSLVPCVSIGLGSAAVAAVPGYHIVHLEKEKNGGEANSARN